jgi:hypothetical protein
VVGLAVLALSGGLELQVRRRAAIAV